MRPLGVPPTVLGPDESDAVNLEALLLVRVRIVWVPLRSLVKVVMPNTLRRMVEEA